MKVLKSAAVFSVAVVALAACAGTRTATDFEVVGQAPEFEGNVLTLNVGESHDLAGRIHFDNETTDSVLGALINWNSSDTSYVTVDGDGTVTAVAENTIVPELVTITGSYNEFSDDIEVVVNPAVVD